MFITTCRFAKVPKLVLERDGHEHRENTKPRYGAYGIEIGRCMMRSALLSHALSTILTREAEEDPRTTVRRVSHHGFPLPRSSIRTQGMC